MKPRTLDATYFNTRPWARRVKEWIRKARGSGPAASFLGANVTVIRQILSHADIGLRVVVNIGADALLAFLHTNDYKNIYENPVVGGRRRQPTKERVEVDRLLAFAQPASSYYFAAVALGGTGVRFYGEYCMVLRPARVVPDTRIFDRDSYDLLLPPLSGWSQTKTRNFVRALRGRWGSDVVDMLIMKMLPRLPASQHLITVGNVSSLVMSDQEFVEVHLEGKIRHRDIEEIRQSPDEVAIEAGILNRKRLRQSPTLVEMRWVNQRHEVLSLLPQMPIAYRIVTLHGKGYQWA